MRAWRSASAALLFAFAAVAVVAAVAFATPPADAARSAARRRPAAQLTVTQLGTAAQSVTVRGRVALAHDTARQRRRTKVAFTLTDARRRTERFTVGIDARRAFRAVRPTRLSGRLSLSARVLIGGRPAGRAVARKVTVRALARGTTPPGGRDTTGPGAGGTTTPGPGTPTPPPGTGTPDQPAPSGSTPLVGLFRLDEGRQLPSGRVVGTYFRMGTPGGGFMNNPNSPAVDSSYTPLRPGTDGGLRTDGFQEPPTPAFGRGDGEGWHALASRIVQPQLFHHVGFSIVTAATDPQTGHSDPLPEIRNDGGRLSGQITAWAAQWNQQAFNQGAPKPDGTLPGQTAAPTGTYDAATGRFVLEWRSLIVGGPFNSFTGWWHLEGTFVRS